MGSVRTGTHLRGAIFEGLGEGGVRGARLRVGAELVVGELTVEHHRVAVGFRAVRVGDRDGEAVRRIFGLHRVVGHSCDGHRHGSVGCGEKGSLVLGQLVPGKHDV